MTYNHYLLAIYAVRFVRNLLVVQLQISRQSCPAFCFVCFAWPATCARYFSTVCRKYKRNSCEEKHCILASRRKLYTCATIIKEKIFKKCQLKKNTYKYVEISKIYTGNTSSLVAQITDHEIVSIVLCGCGEPEKTHSQNAVLYAI